MNVLGHSYVAFRAVGRLNKYLVAGSHLPDLVPFVPDSVFSFEEIHESPEKMLRFLEKKYPHARDLALGMMAHSVKFGVDKFNREIKSWLLKGKDGLNRELFQQVRLTCGVDAAVAKNPLHNYLWSGVDIYLLRNKLDEVRQLAEAHREIDRQEIAGILAECFGKDERGVKRMVDYFLGPIRPDFLVSVEGLVKIWKKHAFGLKEEIVIDEKEAIDLVEKIYGLFEDRWEGILEKVVADVKKNLAPFV